MRIDAYPRAPSSSRLARSIAGCRCRISSQFEGAGVYYGATFMEAQLCRGEEVIVVGGGNAAGQAAVFLAQSAARVHMVVRSSGLAESMSRYLIRRIEGHPAIELRTHTEIAALEGATHLERVRLRDNRDGSTEQRDVRHVFMMAGAVPCTAWLAGCIALDAHGFIKTGPDLTPDDLAEAHWPLARAPLSARDESARDLRGRRRRAGNIKRVASAVGEGSIAIALIHKVLAE